MKNVGGSHTVDFADVFLHLVRRRHVVFRFTALAAVVSLLLALALPKRYQATATLLPSDNVSALQWQSLLSQLPVEGLRRATEPGAALLMDLLTSRSVCEKVLQHRYAVKGDSLTLLEFWGITQTQKAMKKLLKRLHVMPRESGVLQVSVEMESPELAAEVANQFVSALDLVSREKTASRARSARRYIEKQLAQTEQELEKASKKLARFQKEHGTVSLGDQVRVAIEALGSLKGQILAKEIQLRILRQTMRPGNPQIAQLEVEIREMRRQLELLQTGARGETGEFTAISQLPEISRELAKLMREVKVQETVWELLNQQYYQAKIQEARDVPSIQVLDPAIPPIHKTKPRRAVILLAGTTAGFLLSVFWILSLWVVGEVSEKPEGRKLQQAWQELQGDFHKILVWRKRSRK